MPNKRKLSAEELQNAQDNRLKLYNDMPKFHSEQKDAWNQECDQKWSKMEADYDLSL